MSGSESAHGGQGEIDGDGREPDQDRSSAVADDADQLSAGGTCQVNPRSAISPSGSVYVSINRSQW
jgi:hypothetical protein